jgi:hypothetical protein
LVVEGSPTGMFGLWHDARMGEATEAGQSAVAGCDSTLSREDEPSGDQGARLAGAAAGARAWAAVNWPFLIVLAGGIALRFVVIVAYQPALALHNADAVQYLERAATLSSGDSFHPFFYPVLIRLLTLRGSIVWVTTTQHVAGLGMGALVYALMRHRGIHPAVATVATIPALFDGYLLNFEHQIMSETLFTLFIVVALVLASWTNRPSLIAVGVSGFLLALASITRYAGLAVIVAVLAYGIVRRFAWLRLVTLLAVFLLTLGGYGVWFGSQSGSFGITNREGFFLYGRVVSFADCRTVTVPADLQLFCPEGHPPTGPGLFKSGLPKEIRRNPTYNPGALAFAKRMIVAKPSAFLAAVGSDFLSYFSTGEHRAQNQWRFSTVLRRPELLRGPPGLQSRFSVDPGPAAFLRDYQTVAWTNGPLLATLLMLGMVGGVVGWIANRARDSALLALLFALAVIGLLLFPTVFAVYHFRYVLPAIPLLGPAAAFGASAALARSKAAPSTLPPVVMTGDSQDGVATDPALPVHGT